MEAVKSARSHHSGHLHATQRAAKSSAFENSVCAGRLVNARHATQAQAHCHCTRAIRSGYNSKISSRTSSWFGSSVKYGATLKGTRRRQQRSAIVSEVTLFMIIASDLRAFQDHCSFCFLVDVVIIAVMWPHLKDSIAWSHAERRNAG
jgi:hypothetical protein